MLREVLLRFVVGGLFVSAFAILGDVLKPKRFAGLFGAAPSVALATLVLTIESEGKPYAATEARSMIAGAFAFLIYSWCVCCFLMRCKWSALHVTVLFIPLWLATAFGLLFVCSR
jgi:Protein of unknown function (DUF3147)